MITIIPNLSAKASARVTKSIPQNNVKSSKDYNNQSKDLDQKKNPAIVSRLELPILNNNVEFVQYLRKTNAHLRYNFRYNNGFLLATVRLFDLPYTTIHKAGVPFQLKSDLRKKAGGTKRGLAGRKDLYNAYVIAICKSDTKMVYSTTTSLNSRGLPATGGLSKLLRYGEKSRNVNGVRAFLSLLKDYETQKLPINYNIDSILIKTQPTLDLENNFPINIITNALKFPQFDRKRGNLVKPLHFLNKGKTSKKVKTILDEEVSFYDYGLIMDYSRFGYTSPKGGPNGSPSWSNWWKDSHALKKPENSSILENLKWFENYYEIDFIKHLDDTAKQASIRIKQDEGTKHPIKVTCASRLSFLQDKAGKTRTVALGDIYTQSVLKPIHNFFAHYLKKLGTDFTHDQTEGRRILLRVCIEGVYVDCFDLSDATNLMGQQLVIKATAPILGLELATRGVKLMTDRLFHYEKSSKVGNPEKKKFDKIITPSSARYGTGVPMGLLSCFPGALAYVHHCIVQHAAYLAGVTLPFKKYVLLGDDIAIGCAEVGVKYQLIIQQCGMKIAKHKSLSAFGSAEFAKTLIAQGRIVTPLPGGLIDKARLYPGFLLQAVRELKVRYGFTEAKLNDVLNLLPLSKRKAGLIILTCYAVAKVTFRSDKTNPLNSFYLEQENRTSADTKPREFKNPADFIVRQDVNRSDNSVDYKVVVKEPSLFEKYLNAGNNPEVEDRVRYDKLLLSTSFEKYLTGDKKRGPLMALVEAQRKSHLPWRKPHSGVFPFGPVGHHFEYLRGFINEQFEFENLSDKAKYLSGLLADDDITNEETMELVKRTLIGYKLAETALGDSLVKKEVDKNPKLKFASKKNKRRKFKKSEDVFRLVGMTLTRLFRKAKLTKLLTHKGKRGSTKIIPKDSRKQYEKLIQIPQGYVINIL